MNVFKNKLKNIDKIEHCYFNFLAFRITFF